MAKPEAYLVDPPTGQKQKKSDDRNMPEPLSGSKEVKKHNHTGQRHGEGK